MDPFLAAVVFRRGTHCCRDRNREQYPDHFSDDARHGLFRSCLTNSSRFSSHT
jgi:hypothetical protein